MDFQEKWNWNGKYLGLANSIPSNSLATNCCGGERGRGRKAINEVIKNRQLPSAKHGEKRRKIKKSSKRTRRKTHSIKSTKAEMKLSPFQDWESSPCVEYGESFLWLRLLTQREEKLKNPKSFPFFSFSGCLWEAVTAVKERGRDRGGEASFRRVIIRLFRQPVFKWCT